MPQSLARMIVHVVFSTKNRLPLIPKENLSDLHGYIAGICRKIGSEAYRVGGTENHVHIACRLPRTITLARLVEQVKSASSKWMKVEKLASSSFQWQDGYGAFSISPSHLIRLMDYIDNQEVHHRVNSFNDEVREIIDKYEN